MTVEFPLYPFPQTCFAYCAFKFLAFLRFPFPNVLRREDA